MAIFDVQYQPRAHRIVQRALACERMPHAYLFAGPQGVGKEMLARGLAQTLLCASPLRRQLPADVADAVPGGEGVDACGQCTECQLVQAGTHPDFFVVHRQLNRQHPDSTIRKQKALSLSVEVIRHFLVDRAGTRPMRGRAKVFIVREAERLNEAAQNCLLKTLEEPPADTYLILLTHALDRMLPTTRSRCQQVAFQTLPTAYVAGQLAAQRPDAAPEEVAYAAAHAEGSLGAALRCIDDGVYALKRAWGERLLELVASASGAGAAHAEDDEHEAAPAPHEFAKPFADDAATLGKCVSRRDPDVSDTDATRAGLQSLLSVLAGFYVDALRVKTRAELPLLNADQVSLVDGLAAAHSERRLQDGLTRLCEAETHLTRNAHVQLTLETLFIRLAHGARGTTPLPAAG